MRKASMLAVAALAAGLAGLGLGVAQAVTAIPPGTIHGCVQGSTRTLEHVYTNPANGTTCPSGSFQAIWSIKGPTGATGAAGATGPAGPSTAGTLGLDTMIVTGQTTNNGVLGGQASVTCPADHPYAIGGGGHETPTPTEDNGLSDAPMKDSYPTGGSGGYFATGWFVDYGPTFDGSRAGTVYVYAICAK